MMTTLAVTLGLGGEEEEEEEVDEAATEEDEEEAAEDLAALEVDLALEEDVGTTDLGATGEVATDLVETGKGTGEAEISRRNGR